MVGRSVFLLLSASCCGNIPRCVASNPPSLLRRRAAIAKESSVTFSPVPKVVYTTHPDGLNVSEWQKSVTTFAGLTVQKVYGDKEVAQSVRDIDELLQQEAGLRGAARAFNLLRAGAWKADLWRYMVLWAYGGVYLDASIRLSQPIEEFVDWGSSKLTLVEDVDGNAYWNAMMASPPKHPALLLAIKRVIMNVKARFYGETCLDTTGPNMLYRVFSKHPKINHNLNVAFKLVELRDRGWPFEVRVVRMDALQKDGAVPKVVAKDTAQFVAMKTPSSRSAFSTKKDHYSHLWEARCAYCESPAEPHCEKMHPCSMNPKANFVRWTLWGDAPMLRVPK